MFTEKATAHIHFLYGLRPKTTVEVQNEKVLVKQKSAQKTIHIEKKLSEVKKEHIYCEHSKQNLQFLLEHWAAFVDAQTIITFLNLKTANTWSITPYVHAKITDKIKKSVTSLFEAQS